MKILLNVAKDMLTEDWWEVEGVKLKEQDDGTFQLYFTRDLATAKKAEADHAKALADLEAQLGED